MLEVMSRGRTPAVRGAYLRHGRFELEPLDNPELLRHFENVPEMSLQCSALRAAAEAVTKNLLRTAPDRLTWSHGDLNGNRIIAVSDRSPLGLLDFDEGALTDAALDLDNMDLYLDLNRRRNHMSSARYLTAHNQVLAVAEELHVNPDGFHAYTIDRSQTISLVLPASKAKALTSMNRA